MYVVTFIFSLLTYTTEVGIIFHSQKSEINMPMHLRGTLKKGFQKLLSR